VIKGGDAIEVRLGRRRFSASLVGSDEKTDLAVLQVRGDLRAEATWGDSDQLDIGDWVLAIGSPYGLDRSVTAGIVSAVGRGDVPLFSSDLYQDFIQTDAAINPGNSGGPLINLKGEVVGINTAILSESGGYQGIGLAISSSMSREIVDQLIDKGRVVRGYLGVSIRNVSPQDIENTGLDKPRGARVEQVVPGSPADRAGLQAGDIIIAIADEPIDDSSSLRNRTMTLPINESVPVTLYRGDQKQSLDVNIGEMPVLLELGLVVTEGPPENAPAEMIAQMAGTPEDDLFIAGVQPGSPAAQAGLRPFLRITAVGEPGASVGSLEDLNKVAKARYQPDRGLVLEVTTPDGRAARVRIGGPSGNRR